MATYKVRVEDRIGAVSDDTALSDWLTSGARFITNILPAERLEKFTTDLTDSGTGISIVSHRIFNANKSGYGARRVPQDFVAQVVDTASIHYADTKDPVWYILNNLAFIKPAGGTIVAMAYPTVAYGDSTITSFPVDLDEGVVLYASIQGRLRQLSDLAITTIGGLSISTITPPTSPGAISLTYTNTDTALTNQDIELAQGHLSKVNTQISEYGAKLQLYGADISVYGQKIQEEATRVATRINQYNSEYQQLQSGLEALKTEFTDFLKSI